MEFYKWYQMSGLESKFVVFNCSIENSHELCGLVLTDEGYLLCRKNIMTKQQLEKTYNSAYSIPIKYTTLTEKQLLKIMRFIFEDIGDYYA